MFKNIFSSRSVAFILLSIIGLFLIASPALPEGARGYLQVPYGRFKIQSSAPVSALTGYNSYYDKTDGKHYLKPDATDITQLDTGNFPATTAAAPFAGTFTTVTGATSLSSPLIKQTTSNGAIANIQSASTTLSALSGATATATNLIPAGSIVIGVTIRVTTTITSGDGATAFDIGDGTDDDRWGTGIALASGTATTGADFTITSVPIYSAATSVVLTATGGTFSAGAVRVTLHYLSLTAATS
jgi:hypothetical protein